MFRQIPPITKHLLIINILAFLAHYVLGQRGFSMNDMFGLHFVMAPDFHIYQFFTYMFMHANLSHLFFNMFALWMFGRIIERSMGSARFLFFYLTCGIGAALVQEGVFAIYIHRIASLLPPEVVRQTIHEGWIHIQHNQNYIDPDLGQLNALVNSPMVGASGAIYGVLLAFGYLFPNQPIYLYFLMPIKAKWFVIGYGILELVYGVGGSADGVAHFAHLGGMIFGFFLLWYWKRKGVFNNHWFF